jgi:hypothetical protein
MRKELRIMTTLRVEESYHRSLVALVVVAALALASAGCDEEPAMLTADLISPATASAQFFHGNCFAGWNVGVDLRVAERQRVDVFLDTFVYQITDRGTGLRLGEEALDQDALDERYGFEASVVMGGSSRIYRVAGLASGRPVGPIVVTGEITGRDENGNRVRAPLSLDATLVVQDPGPPGQGGACGP